jgi:hypothetical protein
MTTHDRSLMPPSELAIAGSALARIVWSAAARNIATITPGNTRRNASRDVAAARAAGQGVGSGCSLNGRDGGQRPPGSRGIGSKTCSCT